MSRPRTSVEWRNKLAAIDWMRILFPITPEQKLLLEAAINLRAAKGIFKPAYTPEELDLIARASRTSLETGQPKVNRFLRLRKPHQAPRHIPFPETACVHACPQCGEWHRDSGVREANMSLIATERKMVNQMFNHYKVLQHRKTLARRRQKRHAAKAALAIPGDPQ